MAHTVSHKDEAWLGGMAQEVSDFLKGQDDKIIDELKLKMNTMRKTWNLSGQPSTAI